MKKPFYIHCAATIAAAAMLFASCDLLNGENDDVTEDKTITETGEYSVTDDGGHTVIELTNPEGEYKDGKTNQEFADELQTQFEDGVMDNLALNEDKTWSLDLSPDAFLPGLGENESSDKNPIEIPGKYGNADDFVYTQNKAGDMFLLEMPRESGEELLKDMLPDSMDYLFSSDSELGGMILDRFSAGVFSVDKADDTMSLNFKYELDENGEMSLYIDAQMMKTTLNMALEVINYLGDDDKTESVRQAEQDIQDYLNFLDGCTKFELGTKLSK